MAVTLKGLLANGPILQSEVWSYDPGAGRTVITRYKGTKDAIMGMRADIEDAGNSYQMEKDGKGPYYTITIRSGSSPTTPDAEPVRWSLTTEVIEKDIFTHPDVNAEMETANSPAAYRADILAAVKEGRRTLFDGLDDEVGLPALFPLAERVFQELRRGVSGYEDSYLVLRRTRAVAASVTTPMGTSASSVIYDTGQLGIPSGLAFQIPTLTTLTAPPGTAWGWRLRAHESEFEGTRIQQRHEFLLAAWSTLFYQASASPFAG